MITLIGLVNLMGCKDGEQPFEPDLAPMVGTWTMEQVTLDGTVLVDWEQLAITFLQESEEGGTYSFPDSPDHLVWHPEGAWEIDSSTASEVSFFLNDTSHVTIYASLEHTMLLIRDLPWTSPDPCDINDPDVEACVLPVYGTWTFRLVRAE